MPAQKGRVGINLTQQRGGSLKIVPLPGEGSHFLTQNIKGGLGDFTFMLIGIPPAHPALLKSECPLKFPNTKIWTTDDDDEEDHDNDDNR